MPKSESSLNISPLEGVQLPLKGFRAPLKSPKPGWTYSIENMGDGRFRVHVVKNAK